MKIQHRERDEKGQVELTSSKPESRREGKVTISELEGYEAARDQATHFETRKSRLAFRQRSDHKAPS